MAHLRLIANRMSTPATQADQCILIGKSVNSLKHRKNVWEHMNSATLLHGNS